jgi:formylglycine-generating enzyme required for sulfatase activity/serine/threonine protein kinase
MGVAKEPAGPPSERSMPPSHPPRDDLIGDTIASRYRIISRLGAGGMGVTFRAWDDDASMPVVIKFPKKALLHDAAFAERFAREIRLLQGLANTHIVPIVDVGEHGDLPFVVMRFLPGGSLSNRRLRGDDGTTQPNPPGMLHLWLPAVAEALDFVHQSGVVHRDVKPANIFFDAFWNAFLGDFGIAKIVAESDAFDREATLTATSMGIGTPEYMAPELFDTARKADIDGRADQYALAVIAYEMLAGTRPFTGASAHLIVEITTLAPPRLNRLVRDLPLSLSEAVHCALAKRPAERFPTCRGFAAALLRDVPTLADEPDLARLLCPSCSNLLKLPITAAGRKGKCPKCQTEMKVADDLGALWMLDEARRQRASVNAIGIDNRWASIQDKLPSESALPDFEVIVTTRKSRPPLLSRPGPVSWINRHGLLVAALLGFATMIEGVIIARQYLENTPAKGSGRNVRSLERDLLDANSRLSALRSQRTSQLAKQAQAAEEASSREADLRRQIEGMHTELRRQIQEVDGLRRRLRVEQMERLFDAAERALDIAPVERVQPPTEAVNSIAMKFKLIPTGTFVMGSMDHASDEKPMHEVRITRPFYLGVTEVTNAQWQAVMGGDPPAHWNEPDRPVETVNWTEAMAFCSRLSEQPEELAAGRVYRLPTEAEWEYACRAGSTTQWSCGNDSNVLRDTAWFDANSGGQTHPVGQKKPNAWGLHDMHGNVAEWCSDWYGGYSDSDAPLSDPIGSSAGSYRVVRGGDWFNNFKFCRSTARSGVNTPRRSNDVGFRLAMSQSRNPRPRPQ